MLGIEDARALSVASMSRVRESMSDTEGRYRRLAACFFGAERVALERGAMRLQRAQRALDAVVADVEASGPNGILERFATQCAVFVEVMTDVEASLVAKRN